VIPADSNRSHAEPIRVLLMDDDRLVTDLIVKIFQKFSPETIVECHTDAVDGLRRAKDAAFDVVVTDLRMPFLSGLDVLHELHQAKPQLPVILMTGHGTADVAIEAGRLGVHEFLIKPFSPDQLIDAVESAAEIYRTAVEPVALLPGSSSGRMLVGNSQVIRELALKIGKVAESSVPILITGPTGSGKELVARALHQYSDRSTHPFLAVNCAAMSEASLEAELFGREFVDFADGRPSQAGKFEQAYGGTLLLDSISELSFTMQARLLRVLQDREIQRVGGVQSIPVNVRILASHSEDMEGAVKERRFREDLYFRLRVVAIQVPPLSARLEDIPLLVDYFIKRHAESLGFPRASITPDAVRKLQSLDWPGNVRQLENFVSELVLRAREHPITATHLDEALDHGRVDTEQEQRLAAVVARELQRAKKGEIPAAMPPLMAWVEREIYSQAYAITQGNRSLMSRLLGVSRPTVLEKLAHRGITPRSASG
jgi:DNA-binding NtrC family response regulator